MQVFAESSTQISTMLTQAMESVKTSFDSLPSDLKSLDFLNVLGDTDAEKPTLNIQNNLETTSQPVKEMVLKNI